MLEDVSYNGFYRNKDMSVNVMLDNPMRYNLEADRLAFKVEVIPRRGDATLYVEDFTFYLMSDDNRLHNFEFTLLEQDKVVEDGVPCAFSGFMHTAFCPEYLFQCLRIAFYYQPYEHIEIISLEL